LVDRENQITLQSCDTLLIEQLHNSGNKLYNSHICARPNLAGHF